MSVGASGGGCDHDTTVHPDRGPRTRVGCEPSVLGQERATARTRGGRTSTGWFLRWVRTCATSPTELGGARPDPMHGSDLSESEKMSPPLK